MVDWETVERLRSKGWDWDRIAGDTRVDFHPETATSSPGRALRAIYYQRRSKQQRRLPADERSGAAGGAERGARSSRLLLFGYLLAPWLGLWLVLALVFPSPVGVYFPAFPVLLLVFIGALFLLAFGLLRSVDRWTPTYRNTLVVGAVLGLVVAGALGGAALSQGCGRLVPVSNPNEPGGWQKAPNPGWQAGGQPILFFYGSAACPFCSGGSWAIWMALERFGTVTGTSYGRSSPTDSFPNTPEIVFSSAALQSPYVGLEVNEASDQNTVSFPAAASCVQQSYISAYDPGPSIPYVVINGQYLHVGQLVDPGALQRTNATEIQSEIASGSGPAYNAIAPSAFAMMAYIVKTDGGRPDSVAKDPNVASLLLQIS